MKLIKILSVCAFSLALMLSPVMAEDKAPAHKQGGCCKKATAKDKECAHKCCIDAAKKGNECEKCGGAGKIPAKKGKDKK